MFAVLVANDATGSTGVLVANHATSATGFLVANDATGAAGDLVANEATSPTSTASGAAAALVGKHIRCRPSVL
jgi:hypothetical protein